MKLKIYILLIFLPVLFFSCNNTWDEYYNSYPDTVNKNLWDALQSDSKISKYVEYLKQYKLDTLFLGNNISYTLFIPDNDAMTRYLGKANVSESLVRYLISSHFIQSGDIREKRKIQTLSEKFALFERVGTKIQIDGVDVISESPLFLNGRYFIIKEVAEPKPNFYEYFSLSNPILKTYIDSKDSLILDKEKSKPIGFDKNGNTIYDTVAIIYNKFEAEYFPVKHEYRNTTGTIVFPKKEDYENALTQMALKLGGGYTTYKNIPLVWQNQVLIPNLLKQGVFLNLLEPEEFNWKTPKDTLKLMNILGDSIKIMYTPTDKTLLSNGYAYNYKNFSIPDSLYSGASTYEGEWLLRETGINKWTWYQFVNIKSDGSFQPIQELVKTASNDSIIRVIFNKGYSGKFSIEFFTGDVFPRKYLLSIGTHMDIGGIYEVYVNDVLIRTFDYYDYIRYKGVLRSVTGAVIPPVGRFSSFDMYVDNIKEYSKVKIRLEYKGPSTVPTNGFVLDYLKFTPVAN